VWAKTQNKIWVLTCWWCKAEERGAVVVEVVVEEEEEAEGEEDEEDMSATNMESGWNTKYVQAANDTPAKIAVRLMEGSAQITEEPKVYLRNKKAVVN
jgi:hypothetical protein